MATALSLVRESLTDPAVRAAVQESTYKVYSDTVKDARTNNPYALTSSQAIALEKLGVSTPPDNCVAHTHGADKAIENRMLEVLGQHLPKHHPVTFAFLKPSKLRFLRRGAQHGDVFLNKHLEPKDFSRYPLETTLSSFTDITTQTVAISDTVHFLSPEQFATFFMDNTVLQSALYTLVLPPEASHRHPSLYPDVYTLNYYNDCFVYCPGGHAGGAYTHTYQTLRWLALQTIQIPSGLLTIQKIETLGAHHLMVARRGQFLTQPLFIYTCDDMVTLPPIFAPSRANVNRPFPKTFMMAVSLYSKSVKAVSERDLYAKIRQLVKTPELARYDMTSLIQLVNFLLVFCSLRSVSTYTDLTTSGLFGRVSARVRAAIHEWLRPLVGDDQYEALLRLATWQEFTYNKRTKHVTVKKRAELPSPSIPLRVPEEQLNDLGLTDALEPLTHIDAEAFKSERLNANKLKTPLGQQESLLEEGDPPLNLDGDTEDAESKPETSSKNYDDLPTVQPWLPLLKAHGFEEVPLQYDPAGALIHPVVDVHPTREPIENPSIPAPVEALLTSLGRKVSAYPYHRASAVAYASDIKNLRTGLILRKQPMDKLQSMCARAETADFTAPLTVVHGAGGSGKSRAMQELFRSEPSLSFTVVTPTSKLRADWLAKVPDRPAHWFKTFEKALVQPAGEVVVLDDYGKLPAGFVDLYMMTHREVSLFILTGDSRQSVHHETNQEAMIAQRPPDIERFHDWCTFYLNFTHRNARNFANALGVVGLNTIMGRVYEAPVIPAGLEVLTPSRLQVDAFADAGRVAHTYAGSQGLTVPKVCINIERSTPLCSDQVMYTALSRAVDEIVFVNTVSSSADFLAKLDSTPYLKTFLRLTREEPATLVDELQVSVEEPEVPTHLPVEEAETLLQERVADMGPKEDREIWSADTGFSNTVQTEDPVVQAFPHQQAKDETLFWATVDQRLSLSTPEANVREFLDKTDLGAVMFENYRNAMNLPAHPPPFEPELWDQCVAEVTRTYISKPVASLINGKARQDPDFDRHAIALFLKSQWVKKPEKFAALKNKPGQTIASFMQDEVMKYGVMARYMRRMQQRYQPSNVYIHCETKPSDLNNFVLSHWRFTQDNCTNDFTAFDQGQDGATLAFEVAKQRYFSLPEQVVLDYIAIKCAAKVFLGVLAIMRLSGEGPTYDANTETNIAYTHTKYAIGKDCAQAYSGDDQALDEVPPLKPSWSAIKDRFKLHGKPVITRKPEFCGWRFTPHGAVKEPFKLYSSLQLGARTGKISDLILSYQDDASHAYKLGDQLFDVFSEEDMRYHQQTIRLLHKHGLSAVTLTHAKAENKPFKGHGGHAAAALRAISNSKLKK
nr:MAG: RNA replication protein [Hainan alphaflexi-like virus]